MISFTVNWEIFKWSRKKYPVWCFLFCFMMTIFAIPFSKSCFRKIFFFSTWLRFIQFHTTAEYKFYSSSHWLYTRRHWNISRDIKQGAKMSWSKGIEIIQSLFSYLCGNVLKINIKRYLRITHIFLSEKWHLPREIFDLAIERFNKVRLSMNSGEGNGNPLQYSCWRIPRTKEPGGFSLWGCKSQMLLSN